MKCMIPGQNVKVLARALHALARVGDDLFVDLLSDGLVFRTVNSAQSAFAEFTFLNRFFASYHAGTSTDEETAKCKISMKSCLAVFKNPHSMDRMVDGCQLRLEPDSFQLVFKIQFTSGSTKTHFLPIIECESLQVKYNKNVPYRITATAKLLSGVVKNFRLTEDEITLSVGSQKTFMKTHVDTNIESSQAVRTELCLLAGEFEMYAVGEPLSVTFCLKQLRAVVAFAEPASLSVLILFEAPGRPVVFTVSNEATYEANFVVSSLSTANGSQSRGSQGSELSVSSHRTNNSLQPQQRLVSDGRRENESAMGGVQKDSSQHNGGDNSIDNASSSGASRKRHYPFDVDAEFTFSNSGGDANRPSGLVVGCSDSEDSCTQVIPDNDSIDTDCGTLKSQRHDIVSSVFGRCFNETFKRNMLPGYNCVIAYDSDGLEDSD